MRLALEDSSIRTASEAFEKLIDQNREQIDPNERNVLLAHGFFMRQNHSSSAKKEQPELPQCSGSETSVGTSDLTDLACCDELFDYVALGHLHGAQSAGSERIRSNIRWTRLTVKNRSPSSSWEKRGSFPPGKFH